MRHRIRLSQSLTWFLASTTQKHFQNTQKPKYTIFDVKILMSKNHFSYYNTSYAGEHARTFEVIKVCI